MDLDLDRIGEKTRIGSCPASFLLGSEISGQAPAEREKRGRTRASSGDLPSHRRKNKGEREERRRWGGEKKGRCRVASETKLRPSSSLKERKKEANTLLHGRFARVKREFDEWVGWCVLLLLSPCLGHFRVVEAGEGGYRVNGSH